MKRPPAIVALQQDDLQTLIEQTQRNISLNLEFMKHPLASPAAAQQMKASIEQQLRILKALREGMKP